MVRTSKLARQFGLFAWKTDLCNVQFVGEAVDVGGRDGQDETAAHSCEKESIGKDRHHD